MRWFEVHWRDWDDRAKSFQVCAKGKNDAITRIKRSFLNIKHIVKVEPVKQKQLCTI